MVTIDIALDLTKALDDAEELVEVGVSREEWMARHHLRVQTAQRPYIHSSVRVVVGDWVGWVWW